MERVAEPLLGLQVLPLLAELLRLLGIVRCAALHARLLAAYAIKATYPRLSATPRKVGPRCLRTVGVACKALSRPAAFVQVVRLPVLS